jgi:hypothetical protein
MKKKKIREHFYKYVIDHKGTPKKLKHFLKFADLSKDDFHEKYSSLKEVELDIWKSSLKDVLLCLNNSDDYDSYNHREKGLSFIYSWLEFMEQNKNYFRNCSNFSPIDFMSGSNGFKKILTKFAESLVQGGISTQEFKDRGIPSKYMVNFFCGLFSMILKEWKCFPGKKKKKKKKKQEEFMDALVEKSMILFFDSLAPNLFDTFIDLMKHKRSSK